MTERTLSGSSERLWGLVDERAKPNADTETIDRRIWDLFGEKWAVMFTDLAGFSRRVEQFGILHFLQTIHEHKKLVAPLIGDHDGVLLKAEGDSLLVLFRRPEVALNCAIAMQRACQRVNERRKPEEQILLCVGIGFGDLLRVPDDAWGKELNAASKLGEDTAKSGEILLTDAAKQAIGPHPGVTVERMDVDVPATDACWRAVYR